MHSAMPITEPRSLQLFKLALICKLRNYIDIPSFSIRQI